MSFCGLVADVPSQRMPLPATKLYTHHQLSADGDEREEMASRVMRLLRIRLPRPLRHEGDRCLCISLYFLCQSRRPFTATLVLFHVMNGDIFG